MIRSQSAQLTELRQIKIEGAPHYVRYRPLADHVFDFGKAGTISAFNGDECCRSCEYQSQYGRYGYNYSVMDSNASRLPQRRIVILTYRDSNANLAFVLSASQTNYDCNCECSILFELKHSRCAVLADFWFSSFCASHSCSYDLFQSIIDSRPR